MFPLTVSNHEYRIRYRITVPNDKQASASVSFVGVFEAVETRVNVSVKESALNSVTLVVAFRPVQILFYLISVDVTF